MKTIAFLTCGLLVCCTAWAQTAADEKAVRTVIQTSEDAWNQHDYTFSGKYDIITEDATLVNPVGMFWKNKSEIIKAHHVFGNTMFKYMSTKYQPLQIRFLAPTVAIVTILATGRVEQEYNFPDGRKAGSKGDTVQGMHTAVLVKKSNAWKITASQISEVDPQAAAFDPVKMKASR